MRRLLSVAVAGMCLTLAGTAQADSLTADQIVAARQAGFALQGALMGSIKGAIDSGADVSKFGFAAHAMGEWGAAIPSLFPKGTETAGKTKAKAEVWSDAAGFKKASDDFIAATGKFGDAVKSGDKAMVSTAFEDLGKSCGACHKEFREREAK